MTTTMAIGTSVRLSCARCSTSHRVQDVYALKPGMHATCTSCKAIFVVVSMPTVSLDEAAPFPAAPETPRQDPRLVDHEATRAEEVQQLGSTSRNAVFHGAGGTLFGIHLVNTLFTLLTLGFYYYWGKVRVRTYLFGQTEFAGDRFSYHGNARELLNLSLIHI